MKRTLVGLFLIASVTGFAQESAPPDMTVFGVLRIGEPLNLPPCDGQTRRSTASFSSSWCYTTFAEMMKPVEYDRKRLRKLDAEPIPVPANGRIFIKFPLDSAKIVDGDVGGLVVDGRLLAVKFWTRGHAHQERTLGDLKRKYGEPTELAESAVTTIMGVAVPKIVATWNSPGLIVRFWGVLHKVSRGLVQIGTPEGIARHDVQLEELLRDKNPL